MRGEAMAKVVRKLLDRGINLNEYSALEFFAREGDWQTLAYFPHVKKLHAWEIDPQFEPLLKKNLSGAEVEIGNSFELAKQDAFKGMFNLIVLDNPQGIFGDGNYCEHFEALRIVKGLFSKKDNILLFNVNSRPFSYESQPEWRKRREEFYGTTSTNHLSPDFIISFYDNLLKRQGAIIKDIWIERRNEEYLQYIVCIFDLP